MVKPRKTDLLLDRVLLAWTSCVVKMPWLWVCAFFLASAASFYYTINNLGVNTNTEEMLAADLPFRVNHTRLEQAFPQDARTILVVVEAATPELTNSATRQLGTLFRTETDAVKSVYIPSESEFLRRHALLFEDIDDLDNLAMDITRAQPLLGRLARNNSLSEFAALLDHAISAKSDKLLFDLAGLVSRTSTAIKHTLNGQLAPISWQTLMLGSDSKLNTIRQFILVKPVFDYNEMVPAEQSFKAIRRIVTNFQTNHTNVRIRLTGEVALEHEELESISEDITLAGFMSLLLVCPALLFGLRSAKLALATLVTLMTGLILSAGFATVAVGHLNLISVAFAVLYVGLGVDYAIHLGLRYRDFIKADIPRIQAISYSVRAIGPSIILCTITTSIGFFVFIPTAYVGVSELGIISGTAMFIGLFVTLSLLPALLVLLPIKAHQSELDLFKLPTWCTTFPMRFAGPIKWTTLIMALGALFLLPKVSFNFDPISLRDPSSESVTTFKDLLKAKDSSPITISILAPNRQATVELRAKLKALDSVDKIISIDSFIPDEQSDKLELLLGLEESLGPELQNFPDVRQESVAAQIQALKKLMQSVDSSLHAANAQNPGEPLIELNNQLSNFLSALEQDGKDANNALLTRLQHNLLGNLPTAINSLFIALQAEAINNIEGLPKEIRARWISHQGIYRLQVLPSKDLYDGENLREFVDQVQQVAPDATDLPVIYAESGKEVVLAFQQALFNAVSAIALITFLVFRSIRQTACVLMPLFLASVLTGASTVVMNNPFNFANIIALPLLLGLGVDSAIHMVHRLHHMSGNQQDILTTSTARGVFFSNLTTAVSFSSLAFISHAGTASLGQLLTVGITLTLLCTLIILPAFEIKPSPN